MDEYLCSFLDVVPRLVILHHFLQPLVHLLLRLVAAAAAAAAVFVVVVPLLLPQTGLQYR